MNHFTNKAGFDGIRAQPTWLFRASSPPGDHPRGAYFTTLPERQPNLAARLGIPREKLAFVFLFRDDAGLRPIPSHRGRFIFYSPDDYPVHRERQEDHRASVLASGASS